MAEVLLLRLMTEEETGSLRRLAPDQKVEAHLRDRARICWLADHDRRVTEISATVGIGHRSNDRWNHHFTAERRAGLADGLQRGRPPT